ISSILLNNASTSPYTVSKMRKEKASYGYKYPIGNEVIDNWLIKINKQTSRKLIEFIPYEQFSDITYLAKGGQAFYMYNNSTVVLKNLNDSEIISQDFLNELKNYFQCSYSSLIGSYIHKYYGITRHPETKKYIIVTAFAPG
ncbi:2441_t:CDS:2, partial [Racocetra persica]